jgi:protein-S-isoprenylcysteine O-methyltransferase Ste14
MTLFWAKLIWFFGIAGWFAIRYPHDRRSRRTAMAVRSDRARELVLLTISFTGMFVVPAIYVLSGEPKFANFQFQQVLAWLGAAGTVASLWLFYRTHKDLGRNWSVTLEIRAEHALITTGVYSRVRHPMYSAFWLLAVAQALLLPNWFAGPAGIVGFGTLFFCRVGREERLMTETFGDQYRQYVARTYRVIPGVF